MHRMSSEPSGFRPAVFGGGEVNRNPRRLAESAPGVAWQKRQRVVPRAGGWLLLGVLAAAVALLLTGSRTARLESRTAALAAVEKMAGVSESGAVRWRLPHVLEGGSKPRRPESNGGSPVASAPARTARESGEPAAASGEVEVTGRVLDALGGPIVGATLVARTGADAAPLARATSRQRGEFVLFVPAGQLQVEARAEAYSIGLANVLAPARDIHLMMAPSASIIGQVVASDTGAGLAGVLVTAANVSGLGIPPLSVQSGEGGHFRVENVPGGSYSLNAASAAWRGGPLWVAVAVGQASDAVRLVVAPATRVSARVSVEGQPCGNGQIVLAGKARAFGTFDADGSASIDGVAPGSYQLSAICRGALTREERVEVAAEPVERVWDLDAGLAVTGRVLDSRGQAVAGVEVRIGAVATGQPIVRCPSDAAGSFQCGGLAPGAYEARAENAGRVLGKAVPLALVDGAARDVLLRLDAAGSIRASLAGAGGSGLPVYARGNDGQLLLGRVAADGIWFDGLALGHYELFAGQPSAAKARGVELLEAGQIVDVRLAMPRLRSISGRVLDEAGLPVVDAWVRAESTAIGTRLPTLLPTRLPTEAGHAVLTDATGAFELEALPPGDYDISASNAAGGCRARNVVARRLGVDARVRDLRAADRHRDDGYGAAARRVRGAVRSCQWVRWAGLRQGWPLVIAVGPPRRVSHHGQHRSGRHARLRGAARGWRSRSAHRRWLGLIAVLEPAARGARGRGERVFRFL